MVGREATLSEADILVGLDHSQPISIWNDLEQLLDRPVDFVEERMQADFDRESFE